MPHICLKWHLVLGHTPAKLFDDKYAFLSMRSGKVKPAPRMPFTFVAVAAATALPAFDEAYVACCAAAFAFFGLEVTGGAAEVASAREPGDGGATKV